MTLETYNKLQTVIEDMDTSDGATYSTWEIDVLENLRTYAKQANISYNQEDTVNKIWDKHIGRD